VHAFKPDATVLVMYTKAMYIFLQELMECTEQESSYDIAIYVSAIL
jgi:hypothetical protein